MNPYPAFPCYTTSRYKRQRAVKKRIESLKQESLQRRALLLANQVSNNAAAGRVVALNQVIPNVQESLFQNNLPAVNVPINQANSSLNDEMEDNHKKNEIMFRNNLQFMHTFQK